MFNWRFLACSLRLYEIRCARGVTCLGATDISMIDQNEIFGTIFQIDMQWYVRLEGFGGVLFPLHLSGASCDLRNGMAAKLIGRLDRDHRGFPASLHASSVQAIGVKNAE